MIQESAIPQSGTLGLHPLLLLSAGALIGLALFFKYTIIMLLPAVGLLILGINGWGSARSWKALLWLVLGCSSIVFLIVLMIAISGGLKEFIIFQINVTFPYAFQGHSLLSLLPKILLLVRNNLSQSGNHLGFWLGIFGVIVGIGFLLKRVPESKSTVRSEIVLTLLWLAAAIFSFYIQGKLFLYHSLPILPPLAILEALILSVVFQPLTNYINQTWQRLILLGVVTVACMIMTPYYVNFYNLTKVISGKTSIESLWTSGRFQIGDFSVAEQIKVADYIRNKTNPTDRVANFGIDPGITFPVWREPVLRFANIISSGPSHVFSINPPEVLMVKHADRILLVRGNNMDSYEMLMAFTELRDLVAKNYQLETRIGYFEIFRKINSERN